MSRREGNTAKVVDLFPPSQGSSSLATEVMEAILANEDFSRNILTIVEGKVAEAITKNFVLQGLVPPEDPFGPIYLYDLKPDQISQQFDLSRYRHIQDHSDEIEFDDGWD